MKHRGGKCRFIMALVLGAVVLEAAPLSAWQTTIPSAAILSSANPPSAGSSATSTKQENSRAVNDKLAQLDQRVTAAQSSADNAWMLVSAALVLMMTGPGLALFYGGLVRRKNTLAIMMQSFALMALITVLWALVGYSLCFGGNGPVIGGCTPAALRSAGGGPKSGLRSTNPRVWLAAERARCGVTVPRRCTHHT